MVVMNLTNVISVGRHFVRKDTHRHTKGYIQARNMISGKAFSDGYSSEATESFESCKIWYLKKGIL
jgi:hypothetical protein